METTYITARLLRGALASRGAAVVSAPIYHPALDWDRKFIYGRWTMFSPNPFR